MNKAGITVGSLVACGAVVGGIWAISAAGGGTPAPQEPSPAQELEQASAPISAKPSGGASVASTSFNYAKLASQVDPAQQMADFRARYEQMESEFDLDGDGELSQSEKEAMWAQMKKDYEAERIAKFDKDGDGKLNEEEERAARLADLLKSEQGRELARKHDANRDGILDETELAALRAEIDGFKKRITDRYDLDGDGEINDLEGEIAKASWQDQMRQVVEQITPRFDTNGDGQLGPLEQYAAWTAVRASYAQRDYVLAHDTNNDGAVDSLDMAAFADRFANKDPATDLNGDGAFDSSDLDEFNRRIDQGENTMPSDEELPFDDWWNDKGDSGDKAGGEDAASSASDGG